MIIITGQDDQQQEQSVSDQNIPQLAAGSGPITMSLTYSEFLNPIEQLESLSSGGSTEYGDAQPSNLRHNLPSEFQVIDLDAPVPLLQNIDDVNEDFILICEFSELEGPIPLVTIPTDALEKTDINLNSLAVHVMFTDYQVNTVGQFKVCQDTQVMRTNVFKNVHVFMQYFTLYDIKARGFVRPFCFGFVTKDYVKLETNLQALISHFNNITTVLKYSNRNWFKVELGNYLNKLNNAKENYPFIRAYTPPSSLDSTLDDSFNHGTESYNSDTIDVDSCGDTISLQQIEHQYQEIRNIYQIIDALEINLTIVAKLSELKEKCTSYSSCALARILSELSFIGNSFAALHLPFAHPLKRKDELLRPLTVLGQYGVVLFIQSLLEIFNEYKQDLIFAEMSRLTDDFRRHATTCIDTNDENLKISVDSSDAEIDEEAIDVVFTVAETGETKNFLPHTSRGNLDNKIDPLNNIEICQVLEKLHLSCPIISTNYDDRSDSFVTLSECSGTVTPTCNPSNGENESSSYQTAFGSVDSRIALAAQELNSVCTSESKTTPPCSRPAQGPESVASDELPSTSKNMSFNEQSEAEGGGTTDDNDGASPPRDIPHSHFLKVPKSMSSSSSTPTRGSVNQYGASVSDDESVIIKELKDTVKVIPNPESSIVDVQKKPWWIYASQTKLQKNDPGYGLLKFFRHFHSTAHHVLYSILIGRPVVIFGKETTRLKILQVFTCLLPFVPCYPAKSFKLLHWHQGILVGSHFQNFKLIGLCLPERLTVHDLIHPNDLNCVTILDYEARKISGPAYSGAFFDSFSNASFCQTKFFDDLSLLAYIGSILTEIESQVYMFKTMLMESEENDSNYDFYDTFKSMPKIMKQLSLKSSDSEIVKYLSHMLIDPSDCTEMF